MHALHQRRDYTEALIEVGTLGELWDEFGIVGDLIVSLWFFDPLPSWLIFVNKSLSQTTFHELTFVNSLPPTSCIKSLKVPSRTISSIGLSNISCLLMGNVRRSALWMTLTTGMYYIHYYSQLSQLKLYKSTPSLIPSHRIAAVASFSGLRRFPQGRGFKQWTGDDSKALMKVSDFFFKIKFTKEEL